MRCYGNLGAVAMMGWWLGVAATEPLAVPPASTRFQFREPALKAYRVSPPAKTAAEANVETDWLTAWPEKGSTNPVQFGRQIVLQLRQANDLEHLLDGSPLRLARAVEANLFILEAPQASIALPEAARLAQCPEVLACHPVAKRKRKRDGPAEAPFPVSCFFSPRDTPRAAPPNDPYFKDQWNLANPGTNATGFKVDLNVLAAWPWTRGAGVLLAISDGGIELSHPELTNRAAGQPHFNFDTSRPEGGPAAIEEVHGTEVSGLAVAEIGNRRGLAGVAPKAKLASWVIFTANGNDISDARMMDMFQYCSNIVGVQNHSWGYSSGFLEGPSLLEQTAISNAIQWGRNGRGVVMVRSAGNDRPGGVNANDDGYPNDPRVISVAAVRSDGRVASYSNPGTCLLVAAPSGDEFFGFPNLFTTDRLGALGDNTQVSPTNDLADYAFGATGFTGTSGAAPQIAGVAALVLSAHSNLTYRDVQQVLLLSARQFDLADPHLKTNGAGLRVSLNTGFGVPDAGLAVRLAQQWRLRLPQQIVSVTNDTLTTIPELSWRVRISGSNVPPALSAIAATPAGLGPRADVPTASLPLVYIAQPLSPFATNLAGKGALLPRVASFFDEEIAQAAQANAAFVMIYNNVNGTERLTMNVSDFALLPSVFLSQNDGEALRNFIQTNRTATARLQLDAATLTFYVTNTLLCEQVGLRLQTDHMRRGDLRFTLHSPAGTVSVLQRTNYDNTTGPSDWTYYTTHHFYERSAGIWTLQASDEAPGNWGRVLSATLMIRGTALSDTNHDGLDDSWEQAWLMAAAADPKADPDGDGRPNAVEQVLGTDPLAADGVLQSNPTRFNSDWLRLAWPGTTTNQYQVEGAVGLAWPFEAITNLPGRFPEVEWWTPVTNATATYWRVRALPGP